MFGAIARAKLVDREGKFAFVVVWEFPGPRDGTEKVPPSNIRGVALSAGTKQNRHMM